MNTPIVRLYAFILLLFAALVGFTSYWAVFDSTTLKGEHAEPPPADRGAAGQARLHQDIRRRDRRREPSRRRRRPSGLRAQLSAGLALRQSRGYSFVNAGQTGIEHSENAVLAGERNEFSSILDQLRGIPQQGDNVTLTINSHAQQVATQALQNAIAQHADHGAGGAVVALDPSTGAVEAMASVPGTTRTRSRTPAPSNSSTLTSRLRS